MEPTFETPGHLQLEIRIPSGNIRIRAEETAHTHLSITGERSPEAVRIAFADAAAGRAPADDRASRAGQAVRLGRHRDARGYDGADRHRLRCDSGSADLDVIGRVGSLSFTSGSGNCRFDDVDGDVTVKAASGDLSGDAVGGGLKLHSASGDSRVRDVGGDVGRKRFRRRSLGTVGGSVELSTVSGDVQIASVAAGTTSVNAVSGDVEIGVARGTRVYLDITRHRARP